MASEIQWRLSLQINKGSLLYQSNPTAFVADMSGKKGGTPGAITISVTGTDVDLSQLDIPGPVTFQNLDPTNFVEYGIYDPELNRYYPLGEILPGEIYPLRLSRNLGEEFPGTGTGTLTGSTNRLRFRADTADCEAVIYAFEA